MKLTIGQFNESFPPVIDGVANVVQNYAHWLNKKYGSCCVITPKHPQADDAMFEFDVHRFHSIKVPIRNEYRFGVPQMSTSFWMALKKIQFDIVHAHSPFGTGIAARSIARRLEIPLVATFHSKYRDDFMDALKSEKLVEGIIAKIVSFYESADEVWAVNESSVKTLREYGYTGDVQIMENACDIEKHCRSKENDKEVNRMFALTAGVPLFVFVGQHIWQKNTRLIIESLKILKERGEKFHMLFVGDGPRRNDMEKLVAAYGLNDCVAFAGRILDRNILAKIYLRSSALLFPSLYDMSSLVPREAAACGCPTVFAKATTTSQGITEKNGFLIDNNAEALFNIVKHIIENPEHARQVGETARDTIYKSWEEAVESVFERYLYLVSQNKGNKLKQA
ncbi:MAG: glycosyltransferase [Christensenellales bacterium]